MHMYRHMIAWVHGCMRLGASMLLFHMHGLVEYEDFNNISLQHMNATCERVMCCLWCKFDVWIGYIECWVFELSCSRTFMRPSIYIEKVNEIGNRKFDCHLVLPMQSNCRISQHSLIEFTSANMLTPCRNFLYCRATKLEVPTIDTHTHTHLTSYRNHSLSRNNHTQS